MSSVVVIVVIVLSLVAKLVFKFAETKNTPPLPDDYVFEEDYNASEESIVIDEPDIPQPVKRAQQMHIRENANGFNYKYQSNKGAKNSKKDSFEGVETASGDRKSKTESEIENFAEDFDLRSAVIYSEIMTPKFKENE